MALNELIGSMTVELTMLLYSIILTFILIMIPAGRAIRENGAMAQAGARDDLPEPSTYRKRATRLATNMKENMILFAGLVLTANAAGVSTDMTVLGAQIFFYARVAHAIVYLAGWPMIRPIIWGISVVGMGMIAVAMF